MTLDSELTAEIEPFDSFWEAPSDIERGYRTVVRYYEHNYLSRMPSDRDARILVVSCGPGYLVQMLVSHGYSRVVGIDSVPEKVEWARRRDLPCRVARVFEFLAGNEEPFDLIFAEQEINHLTKDEILVLLAACRENLRPGGAVIVHSVNAANPITGSESRAGNFDHYNSFTEHSLKQVLEHTGFEETEAFPLHLYVFYGNPFNYVASLAAKLSFAAFRLYFMLMGKSARIFTKKIGAMGRKATAR